MFQGIIISMLTKYIKKAEDIQTKHEDIKKGFLMQALLKTENASPYIKRAKEFYRALKKARNIDEIMGLNDYLNELISACGFSDKAKAQLSNDELSKAMEKVLIKILDKYKREFREEILYRYLLTKGDALGGSMRNLAGSAASIKLADSILHALKNTTKKIQIKKGKSGKILRLSWDKKVILFDSTPNIIGKNIDVIMLRHEDPKQDINELLEDPKSYIACGELKGGIDPAGADEHWKTANSALGRIKTALGRNCPPLFFIAAAIEAAMAQEIFSQLKDGRLTYAANLNHDEQLLDLVEWLIEL